MTTHKLVPVEPTEDQTTEMEVAYDDINFSHDVVHAAAYRNALAAAPNEGRVSREQIDIAAKAMFLSTMPESFRREFEDGVTVEWDADLDWEINAQTYRKLAVSAFSAIGLEIEGETE
jgi:hypothetical protein